MPNNDNPVAGKVFSFVNAEFNTTQFSPTSTIRTLGQPKQVGSDVREAATEVGVAKRTEPRIVDESRGRGPDGPQGPTGPLSLDTAAATLNVTQSPLGILAAAAVPGLGVVSGIASAVSESAIAEALGLETGIVSGFEAAFGNTPGFSGFSGVGLTGADFATRSNPLGGTKTKADPAGSIVSRLNERKGPPRSEREDREQRGIAPTDPETGKLAGGRPGGVGGMSVGTDPRGRDPSRSRGDPSKGDPGGMGME